MKRILTVVETFWGSKEAIEWHYFLFEVERKLESEGGERGRGGEG